MSVIVEIDRFSGPMELLLHLIKKEEMDIFDINIHEITKQYLDSVKLMKKLNLEKAGEFIAMAATLIHIKARMLVPQHTENGEEIVADDPRKDLVRRLLEYQMYKDASQSLNNRYWVGRDVFLRGKKEDIEMPDSEIILEEDNALYALIAAYRLSLKRVKKAIHKVTASLKSVRDRIREIRSYLIPGRQVQMSTLIGESQDRRGELLITFLSILELAKMGLVSLFQSETYADIHIEAKREIDEDMLSQVESYEAGANTEVNEDIWVTEADQTASAAAEVAHEESATDEEILEAEASLENHEVEDYGQKI